MKYLCYDSALNEAYTLVQLMQRYPQHVSLFAGTDDEGIWEAAPWLFVVKDNFYELQGKPLIQLEHNIIFETKDNIKDVCDYLNTKMYHTVDGKKQYYRIWDARVLMKFLTTGTDIDRQVFFQVFEAFYTEADRHHLFKWTLKAGMLVSETILKADALPVITEDLEMEDEETEPSEAASGKEVTPEVRAEKTEASQATPEPELPKRRRFFID